MDLWYHFTHWHWFAIAALLVILEVTVGGSFFLLWLGASAASVAIVLLIWPQLIWQYQFLLFAAESLACILFWQMHLKNHPTHSTRPNLNRRSKRYIGRTFTLKQPIVNSRGKIYVDDSFWQVAGPDLPAGTVVKVIDTDGVMLTVEPVSDNNNSIV